MREFERFQEIDRNVFREKHGQKPPPTIVFYKREFCISVVFSSKMSIYDQIVLQQVAQGQAERNILDKSKKGYLGKMRVMTGLLNKLENRATFLVFDEENNPVYYTGSADKIIKMVLPMEKNIGQLLFAMLSIDDTLPKKRKAAVEVIDLADGDAPPPVTAPPIIINDNNNRRRRNNSNRDEQTVDDALNPGKDKVTVTAQTYQNYKSALKWWHEFDCPIMDKIGVPWPAEVDNAIKKAIASYKRDVGDKKRRGVMRKKEGKSPYNLNGYKTICKHFMKMKPQKNATTWNEGMFASLFTKLSVNTIGRSDNIDDLLFTHIDWENDALVLRFSTTKSDQAGETTSEKKRLYSNPYTSCVCVILDLAVYTWVKHRSSCAEAVHLFDGYDQNKRYYNNLVDAVDNIPEEIDLGCDRCDIGTHSNRKFAETTSVSKIDGPSRTQVCLRAGQGVGRTQDCYMFSEEDGDSLVGRTVAQLKLDADEFDVLPPHFGTQTLNELHNYGWEKILSGFQYYPTSFQRVVPFLLAHLVYHWFNGNLKELYDKNHPIFAQPLFTEPTLLNSLKEKVILVHAHCADTSMNAQGVPGIILISREIRNFRMHYDSTCTIFNQRVDNLTAQLLNSMNALPRTIIEQLTQKFRINGVSPVGILEIRELFAEMFSTHCQTITQSLATITEQQSLIMNRIENGVTTAQRGVGMNEVHLNPHRTAVGMVYNWPGVDDLLHTVPVGYKFPSYTCYTMWNLWFFGNAAENICAHKSISRKFDLNTKICKSNQSRTKLIMNKLVSIAVSDGKIARASDITVQNSSELFNYAYPKLVSQLYTSPPTRPEDININTLANRINTKKVDP